MKKIVVLGTALLALNALASEVQVKAGFDLNRKEKSYTKDNDAVFKKGPVVGLEYIFDNQGEFEWGVGAEYKLSRNSGSLLTEKYTNSDLEMVKENGKTRVMRTAPVYAVGKFNVLTTKKGNDVLYALGRVGYGFVSNTRENKHIPLKGGVYGAIGLGTEFGPLSLEALYEKQGYSEKEHEYMDKDGEPAVNPKNRNSVETFGLRLGYRFGRLVNDRQPKIVERVVEKVVTRTVEVPVEVRVPVQAPAPKTIVTNNVTLPFSCAADEKVCVIRGFKVDGREPSAEEAADLRTIANIVNQFAEGGTIDFVGHTDSTGSDAYNQKLSVVRAQNVARLLKEYGLSNNVSYGKITGKGESKPADTNGTVQGRYNNRRVELYFDNVDFSNVNFVK